MNVKIYLCKYTNWRYKMLNSIKELKKSISELSVYDMNIYSAIELYYESANRATFFGRQVGFFFKRADSTVAVNR